MDEARIRGDAGSEPVFAAYRQFREGLEQVRGYYVQDEEHSLTLAFEPWFVESENPFSVPCMRITFRKVGERVVLESFVIEDGDGARTVDIDAAHDALQAWVDYMSE